MSHRSNDPHELVRVNRYDEDTDAMIVARVLEAVRDEGIELPDRLLVAADYDANYLSDVIILRRDLNSAEIDDIVRRAYEEATAAAHGCGVTKVHVGPLMWEHLESLATVKNEGPALPERNLFYGHDIVKEEGYAPWQVEVVTRALVF